jgi:hypothetical protein
VARRQRERYWVHSAPDDQQDEGLKPCARDVWCLERTVTDESGFRVVKPALTPRAFCETDARDIAAKLGELPFLALWLAKSLGEPQKGTVLLRVPFGPSIPIRVDVDALLRLLVEVVVSWHSRVAQVKQLTPVDLAYARAKALTEGPVLADRSAHVLDGHLSVLFNLGPAKMPRPAPILNVLPGAPELSFEITTNGAYETTQLDGVWAGNEIIRIHHLAKAAVGDVDPKPERLPGVPCRRRSCDAFTLRRAPLPSRPDDPVYWSQCDKCRDVMTEDEYRSWTRRYAIYANSGVFPVE